MHLKEKGILYRHNTKQWHHFISLVRAEYKIQNTRAVIYQVNFNQSKTKKEKKEVVIRLLVDNFITFLWFTLI